MQYDHIKQNMTVKFKCLYRNPQGDYLISISNGNNNYNKIQLPESLIKNFVDTGELFITKKYDRCSHHIHIADEMLLCTIALRDDSMKNYINADTHDHTLHKKYTPSSGSSTYLCSGNKFRDFCTELIN
jgi:hypothetical protein